MDRPVNRPAKRRTTVACLRCRKRKVRCYKSGNGMPCTNCRLDGDNCITVGSCRRPKPGEKPGKSAQSILRWESPPSCTWLLDEIKSAQRTPTADEDLAQASSTRRENQNETQGTGIALSDSCQVIDSSFITQDASLSQTENLTTFSSSSLPTDLLPDFIQPAPPSLDIDDIEYLCRKEVFILPEPALRDELLRCYVKFVHPLLPLLNLRQILDALEGVETAPKISLLLFTAVMSAAVAFIDIDHLRTYGYENHQSARKAFVSKARILHDLKFESEPIILAQSLLLLSQWYDHRGCSEDVWYYLDLAFSYIRRINIVSAASRLPDHTHQNQKEKRRLYWSCYMQHSLISMALRQPMRMKLDVNMKMLEIIDFELDESLTRSALLRDISPVWQDLKLMEELAKTCIALAELCVHGSQISMFQCTRGWVSNGTYISRCDRELERWYHLHGQTLLCSSTQHEEESSPHYQPLETARGVLTGVYYAFIGVLYRSQILQVGSKSERSSEIYKQKVSETVDKITDLYEYLLGRDLIRFIPNIGVSCLVSVAILHLLCRTNGNAILQAIRAQRFQSCISALNEMRKVYTSADVAFQFLEATVGQIKKTEASVSLALPTTTPSPGGSQMTPLPEEAEMSNKTECSQNAESFNFPGQDHGNAVTLTLDEPLHTLWSDGETISTWDEEGWRFAMNPNPTPGPSDAEFSMFFPTENDTQMPFYDSPFFNTGNGVLPVPNDIGFNFDQGIGWSIC